MNSYKALIIKIFSKHSFLKTMPFKDQLDKNVAFSYYNYWFTRIIFHFLHTLHTTILF